MPTATCRRARRVAQHDLWPVRPGEHRTGDCPNGIDQRDRRCPTANQRTAHARQVLQDGQQAATRHEAATERVRATKARLVAVIPDGYIDAAAAKTALQAEYRAAAAVRSTAAAAVAAHNATAVGPGRARP